MITNQNIRVTKVFTFDMAHALYGYDGPCKNIHGHTYILSVTLKGKVINENNHPKNGMVIDFSDFKKSSPVERDVRTPACPSELRAEHAVHKMNASLGSMTYIWMRAGRAR